MTSFGERLALAIIGPLITVVLGTLIVGGLLQLITTRAQLARARNERRLEQRREENAIRHELLSDMTEAASALYLATQSYWRATLEAGPPAGSLDAGKALKDLDETYRTSRTMGQVLEARLWAYFRSDAAELVWHKVMDLLTVRYFQVIGRFSEGLYERNAKGFEGKEHTGLTVEQLGAATSANRILLDAYRAALREATTLVLTERFRV